MTKSTGFASTDAPLAGFPGTVISPYISFWGHFGVFIFFPYRLQIFMFFCIFLHRLWIFASFSYQFRIVSHFFASPNPKSADPHLQVHRFAGDPVAPIFSASFLHRFPASVSFSVSFPHHFRVLWFFFASPKPEICRSASLETFSLRLP